MFIHKTWLCGTLVPVLAASTATAQEGRVSAPPRDNKLRVLVVTGGHDFEHDEFFKVFTGHPDMTFREAVQPQAQEWFAPARAGEYDVMVWYDMWQQMDETGRNNLVALLEKGKPLVALHHAIGSYQDWPEALAIRGGRYVIEPRPGEQGSSFLHDQKFRVHVADPRHPITRFMKDFDIEDEAYKNLQVLPGLHALLTVEHPRNDRLIAWTHRYGKSPVAYIQLGHDGKAFRNPHYRRLVAQAIRWAAGRLPDPSEEGFTPLFNGRDLDGWTVVGNPAGFAVRDGILRSEAGSGAQWLRSSREYGDFELRVEWRVGDQGNAGVFVRAARDGNPWETGSEIQISNEKRDDAHCTGSLYGSAAVDPRPDESADVWHEFIIRCVGPRITVFADNLPVVDVDGRKVPALKNKPLKGYIGLQDSHNPKGTIEYRKVLIRELKPGA
ncbi:MAG: DUF1080 domain-containing protein [Phycisphaerae bacterium]